MTKLATGLGLVLATFASLGAAQAAEGVTRVVVEFQPGAKAVAAARAALAKAGGRIQLEIIGGEAVAVELPTKMIGALRRHAAIASIAEDVKRYPMALAAPSGPPYKSGQLVPYGIKMVQADQLPQGDANAGNRKICIIDSGIDAQHEDLAGNQLTGEFDSGTGWWYTDENHHGSHVAGTIAAVNQKNVGVVGVNPGKKLKIHIVKVFGADGWAYSSNLVNATKKCQAAGANVITMSLGGPLPLPTEQKQFDKLQKAGILSIAAAGNGGNAQVSYPAGYAAVMSVGGVDENMAKYTASQFNSDVEIAGPAVAVLSSVPMGSGRDATLGVGAAGYTVQAMDGSAVAAVNAPLADFGLGGATDAAMAGKVCLIQRGTYDFMTKVKNCADSGGVGAVVYNNAPGAFGGTLGTYAATIPAASATDADGTAMLGQLGQAASFAVNATNYAYFDGTSMATPHVSAVAALVWSYFPQCTGQQIRTTLQKSALDLGTPGRDKNFGYGLVQAKAAYDRLATLGCNN